MIEDLVSIISPVYNGEKYIVNFLNSVLNQTYNKIELIIINDGSTDSTESIIEHYKVKFKEKNYELKYVKQSENKGQAAAINVGLKLFQGVYMMWMDSDDILYPNAIQEKVDFLRKNKELDYVINKGEIVCESNLEKRMGLLERKGTEDDDKLFEDLLRERNVVFGPASILVRSESLRKAIPDLHIFESREGQNWQLMLPLAYTCNYGYLNNILFKYVVRDDSHSHVKRSFDQEFKRRENFYTLQKETINKIVGMSSEEKKYWISFSYKRKIHIQYIIANRYHQLRMSREIKKKIKENDIHISIKERYFFIDVFDFMRKLKLKLKRIIHRMTMV